ncbi:bax inhibitor-1 [Cryptosporidium ryanae]|uniref:bax inhibitor-1 n=1 Tax=Cryptosporidium ryanae TaxID=515981 RepID=UPI003519F470|nr:bax inhibitor-1 [Cryptosporidium ryanae]
MNFFKTGSTRKSNFSGNFTNFKDITSTQQSHLLKMYSTIVVGSMVTVLGVASFMNGLFRLSSSFLGVIVGMALMYYITNSSDGSGSVSPTRMAAYLLICFLLGNSLGPLVLYGSYLNPVIIPTALATTCIIFVSLSFSVLFTKKRIPFYFTSLILTTTAYLALVSFFNVFTRSKLVDAFLSYASVLIYSFYVYYDTQKTLEAVSFGERDFLLHSLQLYLDAANIFSRIVVILINRHQDEEEKRKKRY